MSIPKKRLEISWEEFRALRRQLQRPNPSMAVMANLGWYAGLRVSEAAQVTWSDCGPLDTLTRRMLLRPETTKNHQPRTIPIAAPLAKSLMTHRQLQTDILDPWPATLTVISHAHTFQPISARAIQKSFRRAASLLGLGRVTPHTLRHTFATRLLKVSSTRLVQLALGHQSITTTELYTHPTIDDIELAMAKAFVEE